MSNEYLKVRIGFIANGTSFNRWCQQNGIKRQNAQKALVRKWNGPKGRAVRQQLLTAAGVGGHG